MKSAFQQDANCNQRVLTIILRSNAQIVQLFSFVLDHIIHSDTMKVIKVIVND